MTLQMRNYQTRGHTWCTLQKIAELQKLICKPGGWVNKQQGIDEI